MASASENTPLTGTNRQTVERPQNWMEAKDKGWAPPVYDTEAEKRKVQKDFLTKVYGILAIQLMITVGICGLFMYVETLAYGVVANSWIVFVLFLVALPLILGLYFVKNQYPLNMILLTAFTLIMSVMMGAICAAYQLKGRGDTIFIAFAITLVIFIGLTIFVQVSEIDFSFMGMFLFVGLIAFMVWGLINILFGFHASWLFALFGCLLFSGFIIYDSYMIMNYMGCDDYMIAVIDLYLDMLNLFSMVLALMNLDM